MKLLKVGDYLDGVKAVWCKLPVVVVVVVRVRVVPIGVSIGVD